MFNKVLFFQNGVGMSWLDAPMSTFFSLFSLCEKDRKIISNILSCGTGAVNEWHSVELQLEWRFRTKTHHDFFLCSHNKACKHFPTNWWMLHIIAIMTTESHYIDEIFVKHFFLFLLVFSLVLCPSVFSVCFAYFSPCEIHFLLYRK